MSFEPPEVQQWSPRASLGFVLVAGGVCWLVVLLVVGVVLGALFRSA